MTVRNCSHYSTRLSRWSTIWFFC